MLHYSYVCLCVCAPQAGLSHKSLEEVASVGEALARLITAAPPLVAAATAKAQAGAPAPGAGADAGAAGEARDEAKGGKKAVVARVPSCESSLAGAGESGATKAGGDADGGAGGSDHAKAERAERRKRVEAAVEGAMREVMAGAGFPECAAEAAGKADTLRRLGARAAESAAALLEAEALHAVVQAAVDKERALAGPEEGQDEGGSAEEKEAVAEQVQPEPKPAGDSEGAGQEGQAAGEAKPAAGAASSAPPCARALVSRALLGSVAGIDLSQAVVHHRSDAGSSEPGADAGAGKDGEAQEGGWVASVPALPRPPTLPRWWGRQCDEVVARGAAVLGAKLGLGHTGRSDRALGQALLTHPGLGLAGLVALDARWGHAAGAGG